MDGTAPSQLRALVTPERAHRSVYTDPALFELEMQRIWGRAWIYVGHESQVKSPGDFFSTRIGRQPVVMARHSDGGVRVLYNRCGHRGALVVAEESGHADAFTCCYHGWRYDTDGRLLSVPLPDGYGDGFDLSDPALGMVPVARAASYRGFVFASLAADGPELETFLGHMATSLDDLVDRAPDGEVEVAGGIARHGYDGNWKLVLENLCDGLHPLCVHASSIEAARAQDDGAWSDGAGEIAVTQMRQNGAPFEFWQKQVGLWAYPWGHSYLGDYHSDARLVAAMENPAFRDYAARMEAAYGADRAREILSVGRWNSNIYPSLSFMSQFRQLRVVHPVSVDRTEVFGFCFRLKGAPDSMFEDTIRFANVTNATASPVLTDDLETYFRIRRGLTTQGSDWIPTARALGTDRPDGHGGWEAADGTSELHIRNMMQAWADYMADAPA
jgi:phenylpropionate dioxygenase-like ring-hydroxylating dioxygenase large terminal subunit